MAERSSQELGLRLPATQLQASPGGGRATVKDYDVESRDGSATQVLSGIFSAVGGLADKAFQSGVQEQVLKGARLRMAGESEAALESDPFTAPFIHNGYKQQDYRIKQADFSLSMSTLIDNEGRKMTPAEFHKKLSTEAQGVVGSLDGLPPEAHMQALMQQTKAEETLITKQTQAHSAWTVEQGTKPFLAQGNSILAKLTQADSRQDDLTYRAGTEEAALYYMNLMNTPAIPDAAKAGVQKNFLLGALSLNQRKVYEDLRDQGALDTLGFEDRRELNSAYERSITSTRGKESMVDLERDATFQTGVTSGAVGLDEASAYAKDRVDRGLWGPEQAINFVQNAQKGVANRQLMSNMVTALESSDVNSLNRLGFSTEEALTKYDQILAANGQSLSQRLTATTKLGLKLGTFPASYGAAVGASVRTVLASGEKGEVSPEMIQTLNAVTEQVAQAETTNPAAGNVLLQGVPETERGAMAFMLQQAKLGIPPGQALKEYGARDLAATQQEDAQKFINSQSFQKSLATKVDDNFLSGAFGRVGNFLTGSANLSDNTAVLAMYSRAVQGEAVALSGDRRNVGMLSSPDGHASLLSLAAANVAERTIQVGKPGVLFDRERTPLILPKGISVDQVFGTRDKLGIAEELAAKYPPEVQGLLGDKSTVAFEYTNQNGLYRIQYDQNGQELDRLKIDPKAIGTSVNTKNAAHVNAQRAADLGAAVDVGNGERMTIDGGNASGMQRRGVYDWRRDLLGHEGYRDTVYADNGKLAVGVGHQISGVPEGTKVPRAQIERWFAEDTDDALIAGNKVAKELGVTNPQAILGLAGAAFQLGEGGLSEFKATKKAIQNKDWEGFKQQVYDSKWAQQTPERIKAFLGYMEPHFTEMSTGPDWYTEATAR